MIKFILKELLLDIVIPVVFKLARKALDDVEETAIRKVGQNVPLDVNDLESVQSNVKQAKDALEAVQGLKERFKKVKR